MITARDYESDADLRAMQSLQQELWAIEGERTHAHVGDLAWWVGMAAGRETESKRRLWFDGDRCVAWAWLDRPASLDYEVQASHRGEALHADVLRWFESAAEGDGVLTALVMEGDEASQGLLARRGFVPHADGKWFAYFVGDLDQADAEVPAGFVLRTVRGEDDIDERVDVHRAVWAPSRMTRDLFRNVTRMWPYRCDLDCVVEAPDGRFAAYVLCWYDEANRVGEFEPVGTHPRFQRQGLGRAVCRYALARLRDVGAEKAVVYAVTDETCSFYESVGFRRHTTMREVRKDRT